MILRGRRKRWTKICLCLILLLLVAKCGKIAFYHFSKPRGDGLPVSSTKLNKDIEWLTNFKESRSDDIPTVVVEEHYEVLKYWFQAVELDLLPRSRNVLLHFDAHVDGAVPVDVDSLPWFRLPHNEEEIYRMMQGNDMFIVAAALTGLIDHFVWVWPSWDEVNHGEEDWSHIKADIEIGLAQEYSSDGQSGKKSFLCACWAVEESDAGDKQECVIRNTTCVEGRKCPKISRSQCFFQSKVMLEIVSESMAENILRQKIWQGDKGLILDIDEDYFGCWSDVIPLYEEGLPQKDIDLVSDLLSSLFCVSSAEEERTVDSLFAALLTMLKGFKLKSCAFYDKTKKDTNCLNEIEVTNFLIQNDDIILNFLKSRTGVNFFCKSEEKVRGLYIQTLLLFLLDFSVKQLSHLQDLGACLNISPGSPNFPDRANIHVCHGDNIPNRTLVSFYLPHARDIEAQAARLKHILTSAGKAPNLISISRSVRDGYTPKSLFSSIEKNLINAIKNTYRKMNVGKVHYDSNLLGGRVGWKGRAQFWNDDILNYFDLR